MLINQQAACVLTSIILLIGPVSCLDQEVEPELDEDPSLPDNLEESTARQLSSFDFFLSGGSGKSRDKSESSSDSKGEPSKGRGITLDSLEGLFSGIDGFDQFFASRINNNVKFKAPVMTYSRLKGYGDNSKFEHSSHTIHNNDNNYENITHFSDTSDGGNFNEGYHTISSYSTSTSSHSNQPAAVSTSVVSKHVDVATAGKVDSVIADSVSEASSELDAAKLAADAALGGATSISRSSSVVRIAV